MSGDGATWTRSSSNRRRDRHRDVNRVGRRADADGHAVASCARWNISKSLARQRASRCEGSSARTATHHCPSCLASTGEPSASLTNPWTSLLAAREGIGAHSDSTSRDSGSQSPGKPGAGDVRGRPLVYFRKPQPTFCPMMMSLPSSNTRPTTTTSTPGGAAGAFE